MLIHSREISNPGWKIMVFAPMIIGVIIFSVFASTFFMPQEYLRACWFASIGFLLIGWGFGLVCARIWKIKEIDY